MRRDVCAHKVNYELRVQPFAMVVTSLHETSGMNIEGDYVTKHWSCIGLHFTLNVLLGPLGEGRVRIRARQN